MDVETILSDKFLEFSEKIKELHARKQQKKGELKAFYEKVQVELKALDAEAKELIEEFESWKKST